MVVKVVLHFAIDFDVLAVVRVNYLPWRAVHHPAIGMLDLVTVFEGLAEQTELVIDAVADGRQIERSHRIQETGGETTQAAVAQTHIVLGTSQIFPINPEFFQGLTSMIIFAGILQGADEQSPHQILEREIIRATDVLSVVHRLSLDQAIKHPVAHSHGRGPKPVTRVRRI